MQSSPPSPFPILPLFFPLSVWIITNSCTHTTYIQSAFVGLFVWLFYVHAVLIEVNQTIHASAVRKTARYLMLSFATPFALFVHCHAAFSSVYLYLYQQMSISLSLFYAFNQPPTELITHTEHTHKFHFCYCDAVEIATLALPHITSPGSLEMRFHKLIVLKWWIELFPLLQVGDFEFFGNGQQRSFWTMPKWWAIDRLGFWLSLTWICFEKLLNGVCTSNIYSWILQSQLLRWVTAGLVSFVMAAAINNSVETGAKDK